MSRQFLTLFVLSLVLFSSLAARTPIKTTNEDNDIEEAQRKLELLLKKPNVNHMHNQQDVATFVSSAMNWTVNPCDDFYTFSCGTWMSSTPIPPDKSKLTRSFGMIGDHNNEVLHTIVEDPSTGKVNLYWSACMNTSQINSFGMTGLTPMLDIIDGVKDVSTLMYAVGRLQALGASPLFGWGVDIDAENPSINIAQIAQGGLNLPDPSMYNDTDLIGQYTSHIQQMFQLVGESASDALQHAQAVVAFETGIADVTTPSDQLFDPFKTYNKLNITGLQSIAPSLPWNQFLVGIGFPSIVQINVQWPQYFTLMSSFVSSKTPNEWKPYLRYTIINSVSMLMEESFANATFDFYGKILYGLQEPPARWEFCISETNDGVGELLGAYYAEVSFGALSKLATQKMVLAIETSMHADLETIEWMDETTRSRALDKLSKVANLIGYPDNPRNYSDLLLTRNQFFDNSINSRLNAFTRQMSTVGGPSDRDQWLMTANTVNAYYDPTRNEMVFPAGIMQTPYFNLTWPWSMNLGGLGMIMGHELSHGFDSQGADYDGNGRLVDWWTPESSEQFSERVDCVINQYSQYEVLPGVYVNGNLTQGENVADMGGIKLAYNAFMRLAGSSATKPSIVKGLTNAQLFFVAYAQGWCTVATPQALELQVKVDPHSPSRFRVIGPLQDLPEFSSVFKCPVGSYMNPPERCEVW